jgi:hypothetical protein
MTGVLERLAEMLRRWRPPNAEPDLDRDAGVRVPRPGAPSGRTSAISLAEPEPETAANAIARSRRA